MADRISVCPNAVDDEWLVKTPGAGSLIKHREGPPVFLFAGRLSVEKRVDRILHAITGSAALAEARLVIAGAGPEEAHLRRLADGRQVEFRGPLDRWDLAELYRQVDALVLSSEYEGLPTVVLEAIASGCPAVIPYDVGLDTALRGWPGIIVTQPGHLPDALLAAVQVRRNGSSIYLPEEFAWSHAGSRIVEVYRRVWRGTAA
jgi:glycosyltransferase involved in cell wall biosynthesis